MKDAYKDDEAKLQERDDARDNRSADFWKLEDFGVSVEDARVIREQHEKEMSRATLADDLRAIRRRAIAGGMKLLTIDEICDALSESEPVGQQPGQELSAAPSQEGHAVGAAAPAGLTPRRPQLYAWGDEVALRGPDAPKNNGHIKHLIEYLLTVYERFGDTTVTTSLQWGATALWKRDEQAAKIATLEREIAAATNLEQT